MNALSPLRFGGLISKNDESLDVNYCAASSFSKSASSNVCISLYFLFHFSRKFIIGLLINRKINTGNFGVIFF